MPRTAPTYTGTPTYTIVSFRWIDANGQLDSTSYVTTPARASAANIEAMAVALGAASNGNLYDIVLEGHTGAISASPSAATEAPRESIKDVIITLQRDAITRQTQEVEIPAPLDSIFVAGTNQPDIDNALYQAVNTAADALLPAGYAPISARFSEHKGTNRKVRVG